MSIGRPLRIAELGTTDLSCPYCGAPGDRQRKRKFSCKVCNGSVRPRDRAGEHGARYYTEAEWFLIAAVRNGELTPDIIAAASVGRDETYSPFNDAEVMARCEGAVEAAAEELRIATGKPITPEDILRGYYESKLGEGTKVADFRTHFDRFRYAELLHALGDRESAVEQLSAAIYLSATSMSDPIVPPGWKALFSRISGRELERTDLAHAARQHRATATVDDAWMVAQEMVPRAHVLPDFLSDEDVATINCRNCSHRSTSREIVATEAVVSCPKCGAPWGSGRYLLARAQYVTSRVRARFPLEDLKPESAKPAALPPPQPPVAAPATKPGLWRAIRNLWRRQPT